MAKDIGYYVSDMFSTPISQRRGIGALNYNGKLFFVKADVNTVSCGLREIRNCNCWKRDVYDQVFKLGNRPSCYILQLIDHPWTTFQDVVSAPLPAIFNREDAQAISRILNAESVCLEFSDTACYLKYFYYKSGVIIEYLDYIEPNNRDGYYEFESQYRALDFEISSDDKFLVASSLFHNKNIYALEVGWPKTLRFKEDEEVRFKFSDLSKEEVKRADYLEF